MGFMDLFRSVNIDQGVREYAATPGAVLLDVRTREEYREGHIPGSRNVPVQEMHGMGRLAENPAAPVFVYCYSGARSRQAAGQLKRMGYTNVKDLGGIAAYTGRVER